MRIVCDRFQVNLRLDGRRIGWLVDRLNESGIKVEYKLLVNLLNNHSDWRLIYAVGLCKVFQCKIGDLFYLDSQGERIDIDFV